MTRPVIASRSLALALAATLGVFAAVPAAHADKYWKKHGRGYDDRPYAAAYARDYDGDYDGDYDWARVIDVRPIVTRVRVDEPRRECWDETRYEDPPRRPGAAGSMVLGGIIGAAIGNQIGAGDGRRAATVAGAIIGSAIGHDAGERRRSGYYDPEPRPYTVQQCSVRYESRYDERVDGYDVTYEYNGRRMRTRLPYDPGPRMRVQVAVAPAEG
jgi:uncharacterized protein YcfJ